MLPSRIYMVKYKKQYLGHCSDNRSVVFGFIKESDALTLSKHMKFENSTKKVDDYTYLLPKKSQVKLKRPIDLQKLKIVQADALVTRVEFAANNVVLNLIDEIKGESQGIKLISNFTLDVDLDASILIDRLNGLYKDEVFDITTYLQEDDAEEGEDGADGDSGDEYDLTI
jgi:hypothetical protein